MQYYRSVKLYLYHFFNIILPIQYTNQNIISVVNSCVWIGLYVSHYEFESTATTQLMIEL